MILDPVKESKSQGTKVKNDEDVMIKHKLKDVQYKEIKVCPITAQAQIPS